MLDLSDTIQAKSDQLNGDDLMGGPIIVTVTKVEKVQNPEQPVLLHLQGFGGRPYKPNLSMRRVLVTLWGKDGNAYAGRSLKLFRDPKVRFGKDEVGGIRISHLSHIDKTEHVPLTTAKGRKRPYKVEPLTQTAPTPTLDPQTIEDAATVDDLRALWGQATPEQQARIQQRVQELQEATNE